MIIKMLKVLEIRMDKHIENFNKELENIKKIQTEGIKSRLDDMKEQICEREEKWKLKRRKKKNSKIMRTVRRTMEQCQAY